MRYAVCLVALVSAAFLASAQPADSLHKKLEDMHRLDDQIVEVREKAPKLEDILTAMLGSLGGRGIASLNDEDLHDLYEAAHLAVFYSRNPSSAEVMQRALQELERRKIAPAASADDMVSVLVAARLFEEAHAYYESHRGEITNNPPAFQDLNPASARPTYLEVSPDGSILQRRKFHWNRGAQVLVIGAPGCHFSRLATQAVEDDATLAALMRDHATWLLPQQIIRDMRSIAAWNRDHPLARMGLIYKQSEWSFLQSTATPSFYFLKDGVLVDSFSGWSGAQDERRLVSALRAIGIDASSPRGTP